MVYHDDPEVNSSILEDLRVIVFSTIEEWCVGVVKFIGTTEVALRVELAQAICPEDSSPFGVVRSFSPHKL